MIRRTELAALLLAAAACGGGPGAPNSRPGDAVSCDHSSSEADTIRVSARLEAAQEALLFGSGRVQTVNVDEGDSVLPGQVLVSLSGDAVAEGAVSSSARVVEAARVAAENARLDYRRCLSLFEAGAISELELEGARTALEAAEAALAAAIAGLSGAVSGRNASVVQAPFEGVVGRVWASEGGMAGTDPILMLTGGSGFVARVLLPEYSIGSVRPGAEAWFETSALPGERFAGVVTTVSPGIDPVTNLLPLTVSIEDHGNLLVPGLYGTVSIVP